ncbi:MAG: TonB-dependent receptor [Luteimonas sp.]
MTRLFGTKKTPVTLLATGIALALQAVALPALAQATGAPADDAQKSRPAGDATQLDAVRVVGYRASVEKALDIKRGEAGVVDAIVAEDIGKFPDLNLAESLQRIPGVVITREAGEGRNISVRGLGPDFTRVRINGMEALSTVGGSDGAGGTNRGRGFDFNVFASDLFSQLIVRKTASAEVEEGSLGATVDLRTSRPFDYDGFTMAASWQAAYEDASESISPRMAALVSNTWADGRIGALLSVAISERKGVEEGTGTVRWANGGSNGGFSPDSPFQEALSNNTFHPRFPRYTLMEHDQQRVGVTAALQFKPTDRTTLSLDGLFSKIDAKRDERYIEAYSFSRSGTGKPETIVRDGEIRNGALVYGVFDNVDLRSESRHDEWSTRFRQLSLDVEHRFSSDFRMSGKVGSSRSEHGNPVQATIMMDKLNVDGYSYDYRNDPYKPVFDYGVDPTDPSGWTLSTIRLRQNYVENDFDTGQVDFDWNLSPGFRLKGGILAKNYSFGSREYRRTANEAIVPSFPGGSTLVPTDFVTLASLSGLSGAPGTWVVPDFNKIANLFGIFSNEGTFTQGEFAASTRGVEEEDRGAYLQGEFSTDLGSIPFSGNFGVRHVRTKQESTGIASASGTPVPTTFAREYSDTLPSMNLVAEIAPDFLIRLGAAKVMSRPGLGSLTPGVNVNISGSARTVSGGNPLLDPIRAKTVDLGFEWYFDEGAMFGVGLFYKDIESFIQNTRETRTFASSGLPVSLLDGTGVSPNEEFVFSVPINTPGGELQGFEANFTQPFTFLPGIWRDFGVQLNYTFVESQIQYLTSTGANAQKTDLTGLSKHSWNATLFYEGARFSGRVSATNRDNYLIQVPGTEVGFDSAANGVHGQNGTTIIDASVRWKLNDQFEMTLEGINLTNEPQESWVGNPGLQLPLEYSQTGRQYLLGLRYKF